MSREEQNIADSLAALCQKHQVKSLVQVGACDGYEAYVVRSLTGCSVTCIEGDTRCEPISHDLAFYSAVIGATDSDSVPFYQGHALGLSGEFQREGVDQVVVTKRRYRLDTFCALHGVQPDALIIDTEGTTLDVLEGAGSLLDSVRLIYAECQTAMLYPGVRMLPEVDAFLGARGFTQHQGLPAYDAGGQGNYLWLHA